MPKPIYNNLLESSFQVNSNWTIRKAHYPKIGVALGGGGAKGVAHIGALKALCEAGIPIDFVSGSSVGTLAGGFFAFGLPFDTIFQQAASMSIANVSSPSLFQKGLFSNKTIGKIVRKHLGHADIQEANLPLAIVTTDIETGELVTLRKGRLDHAVMASCAIPCLFSPVEIGGRLLVDGGVGDCLGVTPLFEEDIDIIIAINLGQRRRFRKISNTLDVLMNACHISMDLNTKALAKHVDIMVSPDLSQFSGKDPQWAEQYFEEGYRAAAAAIPQVKVLLNSLFALQKQDKFDSSKYQNVHSPVVGRFISQVHSAVGR